VADQLPSARKRCRASPLPGVVTVVQKTVDQAVVVTFDGNQAARCVSKLATVYFNVVAFDQYGTFARDVGNIRMTNVLPVYVAQ
jgi:hypothetical protein